MADLQKNDLSTNKRNSVQTNQTNENIFCNQQYQLTHENFGNMAGISRISRERSFVRNVGQNMQNVNKRRSFAFQQPHQQIRGRPALEIYRPPNNNLVQADGKLNVHAQEFTMHHNNSTNIEKQLHSFQHPNIQAHLQHSKSSGSINYPNINCLEPSLQVQMDRTVCRSAIYSQTPMASHLPLINSPSCGNIVSHRVKFAPEAANVIPQQNIYQGNTFCMPNALQRSKSLTSADNLISRSLAGLSLSDVNDIGTFNPEIQAVIDKAIVDPNQLSPRSLMELANCIMERAVEGRRYSLPVSKLCIAIIAKEKKETFLEAMLNICRQWYNERDKVLSSSLSIMKTPPRLGRPRFTSFMSFLTEMFCQLKRRQLHLRTKCDGAPPPLVLLTLLVKCCEDCVKPPVRSLSEVECLFFVLTCIGRDFETHLQPQLEVLLIKVRDAFLNSKASAPAIRRTLLQLIELQASHWQLPGDTVLYYYPTQRQNIGTTN